LLQYRLKQLLAGDQTIARVIKELDSVFDVIRSHAWHASDFRKQLTDLCESHRWSSEAVLLVAAVKQRERERGSEGARQAGSRYGFVPELDKVPDSSTS